MSPETERVENNGVRRVNVFEHHALGMATYAGIIISEEQIRTYAELRALNDNDLSDQRLLYLLLDPNQQVIFRGKYEHINF